MFGEVPPAQIDAALLLVNCSWNPGHPASRPRIFSLFSSFFCSACSPDRSACLHLPDSRQKPGEQFVTGYSSPLLSVGGLFFYFFFFLSCFIFTAAPARELAVTCCSLVAVLALILSRSPPAGGFLGVASSRAEPRSEVRGHRSGVSMKMCLFLALASKKAAETQTLHLGFGPFSSAAAQKIIKQTQLLLSCHLPTLTCGGQSSSRRDDGRCEKTSGSAALTSCSGRTQRVQEAK